MRAPRDIKTWLDIIFNSVPYDATRGASAFGVHMEGGYHRYKTLGHDPVLGWFFGTANIITDSITLSDFSSYRVEGMRFTSPILTPQVFLEAVDSIQEDWHRLPAAIFSQGVHLKSDAFTKLGLPIPLLETFSETLAGKLYHSQYDALCLARDTKIVETSATLAIFINMIISLTHGLFYNSDKDGSRDFYEARTRKILSYSNVIASTSNVITVYIKENPNKLDVAGLLITVSRLFSDSKFIIKLKDEFVNAKLDEGMRFELDEADRLFTESNL